MKYFKNFVVFTGFLAILIASETSKAQNNGGYYFKGEIGYGFLNNQDQIHGSGVASTNESNDDFRKYGIGFGLNRYGPARAEFSFSYSPEIMSTANSTSNTTVSNNNDDYLLMLNMYYDFEEAGQSFVPYISGGIGLSRLVPEDARFTNTAGAINLTEGSEARNNPGWALGLGAAIKMEENVSLDMGYRYLAMGQGEGNGVFTGTSAQASNSGARIDDLFVHEVYLGLRVGF